MHLELGVEVRVLEVVADIVLLLLLAVALGLKKVAQEVAVGLVQEAHELVDPVHEHHLISLVAAACLHPSRFHILSAGNPGFDSYCRSHLFMTHLN